MANETDAPDWVTLTSDERVVWTGHPSIRPVGWWLFVALVLIALGIAGAALLTELLQLLSLVLIPIGLLIAVMTYVQHRSVLYVLTSEEIYKKTGVLSRDVTNIRLDRIQNTSYSQSLGERLLSYGTIHVDTAGSGGTEIVLEAIPNPERVNGLITEQLDTINSP